LYIPDGGFHCGIEKYWEKTFTTLHGNSVKNKFLQQIFVGIWPQEYSRSLLLPPLTETLTSPSKVFCGFLQVPHPNIIINVKKYRNFPVLN
jgi:hypothetical protein